MQPLHADPGHFFTATEQGIRRWFREFKVEQVCIPPNFHPVYAFAWMASELLYGCPQRARDELEKVTIAELAEFWAEPTARHGSVWDAFAMLPDVRQRGLAAGFELRARSRRRSS